jgi:hypothetical protein
MGFVGDLKGSLTALRNECLNKVVLGAVARVALDKRCDCRCIYRNSRLLSTTLLLK